MLTDKKNVAAIELTAGVLLFIPAGIMQYYGYFEEYAIYVFITGIVMIVVALLNYIPGSRRAPDERTKKLTAYAATWAFYLNFMLISVLCLLLALGLIQLSGLQAMTLLFWTMIISLVVMKYHFQQKGDVE